MHVAIVVLIPSFTKSTDHTDSHRTVWNLDRDKKERD